MWERTAEREVTRNRRALLIPPVKKHRFFLFAWEASARLHQRGEYPRRKAGDAKMGDPLLSYCAPADGPKAAQSLPDVVHYRDRNELRKRVRRRRRRGRRKRGIEITDTDPRDASNRETDGVRWNELKDHKLIRHWVSVKPLCDSLFYSKIYIYQVV